MNDALKALLAELESFGSENDASHSERPRRMLNITLDTGEFLAVWIRATQAHNILEIGTSNGYSTLWLAWAAQMTDGQITTLEYSDYKIALAEHNFQRSGLSERIRQIQGDAGAFIHSAASETFDLIFLDSERSEYLRWWPNIRRLLRRGGALIVDNALSHQSEMADFAEAVLNDADFTCCTMPVGNGELIAVRSV